MPPPPRSQKRTATAARATTPTIPTTHSVSNTISSLACQVSCLRIR